MTDPERIASLRSAIQDQVSDSGVMNPDRLAAFVDRVASDTWVEWLDALGDICDAAQEEALVVLGIGMGSLIVTHRMPTEMFEEWIAEALDRYLKIRDRHKRRPGGLQPKAGGHQ